MISRRVFLHSGMAVAGAAAWLPQAMPAGASAGDSLERGCIDGHVHVWTPDTVRYPLQPGFPKQQMAPASFTPEQLLNLCRPCGVERIVLIQMSFYGTDNSYMLDTIARYPGVFSGVAQVDGDPRPRQSMLALAKQGVRGFRLVAVDQSPDRWLAGDEMSAIWKCAADERLVLGLLMAPAHLESVGRMCERYPQTPVVIDHLARIGIDGQIRSAEVDRLCGLARHKQLHVKISAFYALGRRQAPYLDLGLMIRRVRDSFGPQRLMWGSDSPFQVNAPHTYRDSIELLRTRLDFLSADDRRCLLRTTAQRLFFT